MCVQRFLDFVEWSREQLAAAPMPVLDAMVESYVEFLFRNDEEMHVASYVLAATVFFLDRSLRAPDVLVKSKLALSGWKKQEPPASRLPLPWAVACLMAVWLAQQNSDLCLQVARALVIQFDTFARPGEIVTLPLASVIVPHKRSRRAYGQVALVFAASDDVVPLQQYETARLTKTGDQDDTVIIDTASFPHVASIVLAAVASAKLAGSVRLFGSLTPAIYNHWVQRAARDCGIPFEVCPHMARHGGASEAIHRNLRELKGVQLRGRWRCFESVRRYQKQGKLLAQMRRLSKTVAPSARRAEDAGLSFLS